MSNYHFDLTPTHHTKEMKIEAIEHWKRRIEKHSKPSGCPGCLEEAKNNLKKWEALVFEEEK